MASRSLVGIITILVASFVLPFSAAQHACEYASFVDALPGNAGLFKLALDLSGYKDKLPSPSAGIPLTLLVPSNNAFLSMLWKNGFFLPILSKVGDALPATVLYNTMLGGIGPQQVQQYAQSANALSPPIPTTYSLLSGASNYSLQYYTNPGEDGKPIYYFKSQVNGGLAGANEPINVCGSYIYITDEVLVPSSDEKLGGVKPVAIPDNLPWSNTGGGVTATATATATAPAPSAPAALTPSYPPNCVIPTAPGTTTTTLPTVAPAKCATSFAQAAKDNGLSILSAALEQPAISSQLPDPSEQNTLLAPIDTAFFSMLTSLNISITDALGLGNKLAGVILYHVHPLEALSLDQIRSKTSLTTALGTRLNQPDKYVIGVDATGPDTIFTSLKPGNTAKVIKEIKVCNTNVLVIDNVLVPADTVVNLPDPGPAPTPTTTLPTTTTSSPSPTTPKSPSPSSPLTPSAPSLPSPPTIVPVPPSPKPVLTPIQLSPSLPKSPVPVPTQSPPVVVVVSPSPPPIEEESPSPTPIEGESPTPIEGESPALPPSDEEPSEVTVLRTGVLDNGIASGIGPFANCLIQLFALGNSYNATTDVDGRFSFPGVPECAVSGASVSLPSGLDQFASCIDTSTGLPPPYTLSALLETVLGNLTSILTNPNAPGSTTDPINLSPISTLVSSPSLGSNVANGGLSTILQQVSSLLGFNSEQAAVAGNIVQGLASGSSNALASVISNAQSMITGLIGGNALSGLFPGVGVNKAVSAVNDVLAANPSSLLNLTDSSSLQSILQQAMALLQSTTSTASATAPAAVAAYEGGSEAQPLSRKILQTTAAAPASMQIDPAEIFKAISEPMALLNTMARDGAAPGTNGSAYNPEEVSNLLARCALVAQNRVGPAASDLASGQIGVSDFSSSYTPQKVMSAVSGQSLPSVLQAPPAAVVAASPSPPASSAMKKSSGSVFAGIASAAVLFAVIF